MPSEAVIATVIAKHNALSAGADPAADSPSAPPAGVSAAGSAPADEATSPGNGTSTSPGASSDAPLDHDVLQAKLDADRARQRAKENRRKSKAELDEATKTKADADAELAKWKSLGKDKKWLDALKEAGHDPIKVYEEMRQEALKAGTPAAQLEALERKHATELEGIRAELAKEREAREAEKTAREEAQKTAQQQREARVFQNDFQRALAEKDFAPLVAEYEPAQLFGLAQQLFKSPKTLFTFAKNLKVDLTAKDGTFTMKDIFAVMRAQQAAHEANKQRRNQSAAPHTSEAPVTQESEANPTVNGTEERKAGPPTTIGNHIATSRASEKSEKELRASMNRDEWRAYVRKKHENARI